MLLNEILAGAARRRPDHVGLVGPDGDHSYAELAARAARLAAGLARYTEPGDRVAILADNGVEYIDCLYGCSLAGTTLTMVNQRLTRPEIEFVLADAEPSVLLVGADHLDRVADIRTCVPSIRHLVVIGDEAPDGLLGYRELLAAGAGADAGVDLADRAHRDPAETAWLIYTSGTTGRPKGAMLSHRAVVSASLNAALEWRPTADERVLFCFPLCHVAAFIPVVYHLRAATVVMMRGFDPAAWLDLVTRHRVTHAGLAPTMLDFILRAGGSDPAVDRADLDSIELIVYGGSPIPPPLLEAGIKRFGDVFMGSYGMTELSGNVLMLGLDEHRRAVAGEPGLLQAAGRCECLASVRVVDDHFQDVAVGEVGEIVVAGDQVMTGYWRAEAATAEVLADGWLRTGDLARVDAEGLFYIVDRKKDMIVTGAENVYPREVEVVLSRCPGVRDVAVVGLPDERWGEVVTAVVVPEPGAVLDDEAVREFGRQALAGYKLPKQVRTVEELPRNAAGKVLKRRLRDELAGRAQT